MASRPRSATNAQAQTSMNASAPTTRVAKPPAPERDGGLSRNSSTPTEKPAMAAALRIGRIVSSTPSRLRGGRATEHDADDPSCTRAGDRRAGDRLGDQLRLRVLRYPD